MDRLTFFLFVRFVLPESGRMPRILEVSAVSGQLAHGPLDGRNFIVQNCPS